MTVVRQQSAATMLVKVDDKELPADVALLLTYVIVEDNLNLPDAFSLSFLDPNHVVLEKTGVHVASKVTITVFSEVYPGGERLFDGEVTALEVEFDGGRTRTIVRGFDKVNRLYRGRSTRAFKDVKYPDIVKEVARGAGLDIGRVDTPPGRPVAHVTQGNVTDGEFLTALAGEVGFVFLVQDGKVNFHPATESGDAPDAGNLRSNDPLQLIQGDNLLRFSTVVTADSQVKEVTVRGWDIAEKKALVTTIPAETTTARVGISPADLAHAFDDHTLVGADVPYGEQGQVDAAAKALAEQVASAFAEFEGVARGNPKLKAGCAVSLGLTGAPFDGEYTLTATRHVYDNGEYVTHFASTGRHDRSLHSLTSGVGATTSVGPGVVTQPIAGVVSAIVTNVKDEDGIGQVKVKMPRLDETFESDWLRTVQPGAGADRGGFVLPEVDDEVLVAFEHGDLRRGYVLGGIYNGRDKPNPFTYEGAVGGDGRVCRRSFTSRNGHFVLIDDTDGDEHIEIATKDSKFALKLAQDEEGGIVMLSSNKLVLIDVHGDVTIQSKGKVKIDAVDELNLHGRKIVMTADTDAEISGINVKIAGSAQTEITGARAKVSASGQLELQGSGLATLSGGLVKIN